MLDVADACGNVNTVGGPGRGARTSIIGRSDMNGFYVEIAINAPAYDRT